MQDAPPAAILALVKTLKPQRAAAVQSSGTGEWRSHENDRTGPPTDSFNVWLAFIQANNDEVSGS